MKLQMVDSPNAQQEAVQKKKPSRVKHNLSKIFQNNDVALSEGFNDTDNIYDEDILLHIGDPKKKYKKQ